MSLSTNNIPTAAEEATMRADLAKTNGERMTTAGDCGGDVLDGKPGNVAYWEGNREQEEVRS